jgi:hypothetical protein
MSKTGMRFARDAMMKRKHGQYYPFINRLMATGPMRARLPANLATARARNTLKAILLKKAALPQILFLELNPKAISRRLRISKAANAWNATRTACECIGRAASIKRKA